MNFAACVERSAPLADVETAVEDVEPVDETAVAEEFDLSSDCLPS